MNPENNDFDNVSKLADDQALLKYFKSKLASMTWAKEKMNSVKIETDETK